jgi:hypothetical protein
MAGKVAVKDSTEDWDVAVEFAARVDKRTQNRPTVDVPPKALELVRTAYETSQWLIMGIKGTEDYEKRANVLYSAGALVSTAEKPVSVTIVPGIVEDGNFLKSELDVATHLRATVSQRRGRKSTA